jgi:hypothetical protein
MSQYKLLVKNLLTTVDPMIIKSVFETVGICKVEVRGDQALVEYATDDNAKKAYMSLNNTNLLSVNQNNKVVIDVIGPQNVILTNNGTSVPQETPNPTQIQSNPNINSLNDMNNINKQNFSNNIFNKQALGDITATLNNTSSTNTLIQSMESAMNIEDKNAPYIPYYVVAPAKKSQKISRLIGCYFECFFLKKYNPLYYIYLTK